MNKQISVFVKNEKKHIKVLKSGIKVLQCKILTILIVKKITTSYICGKMNDWRFATDLPFYQYC